MVLGGKSFTVVSDARGLDSIFRDRHRAFNVHPAHLRIAKAVGGVKRADEVVHIISDRLFPLVTRELGREGMNKFIPSFNADLLSLVEAMAARVRNSSHGAPIPLMPFIGKSLYHAINMAAYGPLYPFESYDDFEVCDFDLILLLSRIPFLSRRVVQSQQRIIRSLGDYIDRAWSGGQLEGASVLTSEVVSILKDSNLDDPDVAGAVFTFTWGMLSNPIRITYWLMVFILNDAMATTRIREEVDRELRDHFGGDLKQMLAAPFTDVETRFPLLESAVHETMRMGILQTALREAHADTEIYTNSGMMQVQKGDLLMTNIYPVHMDPETFSDPETFRPDRFLDEKTRAHMGFGGGRHLVCVLCSVSIYFTLLTCHDIVQGQAVRSPRCQDARHLMLWNVRYGTRGRFRKECCR